MNDIRDNAGLSRFIRLPFVIKCDVLIAGIFCLVFAMLNVFRRLESFCQKDRLRFGGGLFLRHVSHHALCRCQNKTPHLLRAAVNLVRTGERKGELPRFYRPAFGGKETVWREASPTLHVMDGRRIPPFRILYVDRPVSPDRAKELAETLREHGYDAEAVLAKNRSHKSLNNRLGMDGDKYGPMIADFFRSQMN